MVVFQDNSLDAKYTRGQRYLWGYLGGEEDLDPGGVSLAQCLGGGGVDEDH